MFAKLGVWKSTTKRLRAFPSFIVVVSLSQLVLYMSDKTREGNVPACPGKKPACERELGFNSRAT